MKHIKFEENIDVDESYKRDKAPKKEFVQKAPEPENEDNYDIPETKKWHQEIPEEPADVKPLSLEEVSILKREATSFLHGESLANETKMSRIGSSDQKWARSLLLKGAMADRVAAATVLIQDSPIHNLSTLQNLVAMVKPAKKKDSLTAIETLSELFIFDLLIPDCKLRPFETRPLSALEKMCSGNKDHRKKILMIWIFEDKLKETYAEFIKCLNNFAHDTIEAHKEKAVSAMAKLLMHNPEQEKVLLSSIVNKLGDPSQKVASKVIYQLCQVLYNHPNMKGVVLGEIEKMLFRPNISSKAQYYGICFLNQFYLAKDDSKIAENLVRVYFSFFRACIKKGEVDTRLMGGILTGVRRCQPFLSETASQTLQTQAHPLHRLVHLAGYTVALQALALLQQMGPTDRYYCALYKKLGHPETLTTTLPAMLLGLVYRSVKTDDNAPRVLAFLKRLLQLAANSDAGRAAAMLLVVARLARRHRLPLTREAEQIKEEAELNVTESTTTESNGHKEESSNITLDTESTECIKKSKKKPKTNGEVETSEDIVEKKVDDQNKNNIGKVQDLTQKSKFDWWVGDKLDLLNDEDDDEVYHDIPLEEDELDHKKKLHNLVRKKKENSSKGWLHTATLPEPSVELPGDEDLEEQKEGRGEEYTKRDVGKEKEFEILIKKSKNMEKVVKEYMPLNRNPAYCGAEHSVVTELLLLKNHFHPSVRLFSEKLLEGSIIQYNGDPLKDFSIARFLDRFAFKNPKKEPSRNEDGQPVPEAPRTLVRGSHPKFAVRKNYAPGGIKSLAVNSAAYLNEDSSHIPVDERFLYDYFQMRRQQRGDDESDAESDAGSVGSVEFEKYLDSLAGAPKKSAEDSDDEDDMDYMKEMVASSKLEKKGKRAADENQEDEDDESDMEDDDIDDKGSLPSDMDEGDIDDDDDDDGGDDSDLVFSDEDGDEAMLEGKKEKKGKKGKKSSKKDGSDLEFSEDEDDLVLPVKKKGKKGVESMFASAEEFATLLEETGTNRKQGTSQAVSTTDNANVKQLHWEEKRDHWVRGKDRKTGKFDNKTGGFKKGGKFEKSGKFDKGGDFNRKRKAFGAGAGGKGKKRRN